MHNILSSTLSGFHAPEGGAVLTLDKSDLAVTGIHKNMLYWFQDAMQKSPSWNRWELLNFQVTTKHSQIA